MGQLDLKKLSKGMNIKDKMKLLFEDMNRQAETNGKEFILKPQERDAIIEDARKNNQLSEIRKTHELYKIVTITAIDLHIILLGLYLSIGQLEKTLMGVILKSATEEIIGEMIYDFAKQIKTIPAEIDKYIDELREKYKVDSVLFEGFDFFNPPLSNNSIFSSDLNYDPREPNQEIQKIFLLSIVHAKKIKKKIFEMSYLISKAPIDFLPESTKKLIKESEELLTIFSNLDSTLKPLGIYRDYELLFVKNNNLPESEFISKIRDINKNLELNTEDKKLLEDKIDKSLEEADRDN